MDVTEIARKKDKEKDMYVISLQPYCRECVQIDMKTGSASYIDQPHGWDRKAKQGWNLEIINDNGKLLTRLKECIHKATEAMLAITEKVIDDDSKAIYELGLDTVNETMIRRNSKGITEMFSQGEMGFQFPALIIKPADDNGMTMISEDCVRSNPGSQVVLSVNIDRKKPNPHGEGIIAHLRLVRPVYRLDNEDASWINTIREGLIKTMTSEINKALGKA